MGDEKMNNSELKCGTDSWRLYLHSTQQRQSYACD